MSGRTQAAAIQTNLCKIAHDRLTPKRKESCSMKRDPAQLRAHTLCIKATYKVAQQSQRSKVAGIVFACITPVYASCTCGNPRKHACRTGLPHCYIANV